jgi:hypothetical protein
MQISVQPGCYVGASTGVLGAIHAAWSATQVTRTREATSNRNSMQAPKIRPNARVPEPVNW